MQSIEHLVSRDGAIMLGVLLIDLVAIGHALLYKRDARASLSWCLWIFVLPIIGAAMYYLFGINRVQRKALKIRQRKKALPRGATAGTEVSFANASALSTLVSRVTQRPLLGGNQIRPLRNGDEAYPEMLRAIEGARRSIGLSTYIFDWDRSGQAFGQALAAAVERGVEVRVLIDSVGSRYSIPTAPTRLRRLGVRTETFLPVFNPFMISAFNLRSHRKSLTVDGEVAFTGGINIREGHVLALAPRSPVRDLHFRIEGPVVTQIQEIFADDWQFSSGERLEGERWFPSEVATPGQAPMRMISSGPDQEFECTKWAILGALIEARTKVEIVTPYFLPDSTLISALNVTAMRGVSVEITIPKASNLPFVDWASRAQIWQVLDRGCRVFLSGQPFDHSKLMRVDRAWLLLGSSNWDNRSLRLNFELDLECWSEDAAIALDPYMNALRAESEELTLDALRETRLPARLRNSVIRLASPFL
jgi:cardiolipin synthase